jgi:predicted MPP superfamily phosphohydrolase
MLRWVRFLSLAVIVAGYLWMHFRMGRWLAALPSVRRSPVRRFALWLFVGTMGALLCLGLLLGFSPVARAVQPALWPAWVRAASFTWALLSLVSGCAVWLWRHTPEFDPQRRRLLRVAGGAALAAPVAATGFGMFVERGNLRVSEVDIPLRGLPRDLDGLRMVQLTDIHIGPFLSEKELARAVNMANELRPHLALVTGDFITSLGDPLDACLYQLGRLKADAGVLGCLGNHEGYAGVESYTTRQSARRGIRILRQASVKLRFGRAALNLAGVDYQSLFKPYLRGAEAMVRKDSLNVLLSHNPDVFPVAARQGFDLTIAGHTHGGQVNFEIFRQSINVARFYTPYTYGLYRHGRAAAYVNRGIGTVGIPARIGAPPEIALIRLCAT